MVARFLKERSILTGLRHENLVGVHDLVVEGDTVAIVMDLVRGGDLGSGDRLAGSCCRQRWRGSVRASRPRSRRCTRPVWCTGT